MIMLSAFLFVVAGLSNIISTNHGSFFTPIAIDIGVEIGVAP